MTTNSNFATGGLVGVIKASNGVTMSDSTVEGSISGTISGTKLGGILGRKTNTNQNSKDIIKGCLVTAEVKMSGEGSNMIGGIFGALQGSTVSGDYVGGITIEKSAFTACRLPVRLLRPESRLPSRVTLNAAWSAGRV